jgi:hypothetical protein
VKLILDLPNICPACSPAIPPPTIATLGWVFLFPEEKQDSKIDEDMPKVMDAMAEFFTNDLLEIEFKPFLDLGS